MQDRFDLVVSFVTSIVVALIVGSVYLQLPQTSAGAFTRGGVIFIAILFNSFQVSDADHFNLGCVTRADASLLVRPSTSFPPR